jgi:hypothetical protein
MTVAALRISYPAPVLTLTLTLTLTLLLACRASSAYQVSLSPRWIGSVPAEGRSPWTSPEDASCDSPRAAASECYARSETQALAAWGFDFSRIRDVRSVEARVDVSAAPVPPDGWTLRELSFAWGGGSVDLAGGRNGTPFFAESASLRVRVEGPRLDGLENSTIRAAFAARAEDVAFLVSCVRLSAGSEWEPPDLEYRPWLVGVVGAAIAASVASLVRGRWHRSPSSGDPGSLELRERGASLWRYRVTIGRELLGCGEPDAHVSARFECEAGGCRGVACLMRESRDWDRFRRLARIRHGNLLGFLGLHEAGSGAVYAVWETCGAALNAWRADREPCPEDAFAAAWAAACGLRALYAHAFVHGDVSCRNMVVFADGRFALAWAGHATGSASRRAAASGSEDAEPPHVAPEVALGGRGAATFASDVWGLGVLCAEALRPADWTPRLPLQRPPDAPDALWTFAKACTRTVAASRPDPASALRMLASAREAAGYRGATEDEDPESLLIARPT